MTHLSFPLQLLSNDACASGQLEPTAMAELAQAGFRSVVNNRPDFEGGPSQPASDTLEVAARQAGLQYVYLPVASGRQTPQDVARLAGLLATLPRPVLLFCRSGARSSQLYQLATQASEA